VLDTSIAPVKPVDSAAVILLRDRSDGRAEVFLVRRHRSSSFLPSMFVFPGGKLDKEDGNHEAAAARELFEEAGVLLSPNCPANLAEWRRRILGGEASFRDLVDAGVVLDTTCLRFWSRWITPSLEPRRFDARFYLAMLPADQQPSFDDKETVDAVWVTPAEALEHRHGRQLPLPPPQVRTLMEMSSYASATAILEAAAGRERHGHPILPRVAKMPGKLTLLLPWDPEYFSLGLGEALPIPVEHPSALGASRFAWDGVTWRHASP
jgi:8-oxo-dGTP pyrophosphatase MutT (NUDIX family)